MSVIDTIIGVAIRFASSIVRGKRPADERIKAVKDAGKVRPK